MEARPLDPALLSGDRGKIGSARATSVGDSLGSADSSASIFPILFLIGTGLRWVELAADLLTRGDVL